MGLVGFVKNKMFGSIIDNLAKSEPKTTVLGFILAGIQAANIDYGKLLQKDPEQIGRLVAAVVTAILGYYVNHPKLVAQEPPKQP